MGLVLPEVSQSGAQPVRPRRTGKRVRGCLGADAWRRPGAARLDLVVWSRSKQETLALPVSALALLILGDYRATGGWNWRSWMFESKGHGTAVDHMSATLSPKAGPG